MIRLRDIAISTAIAALLGFVAVAVGSDGQTEVTTTLIRVIDADTLVVDVTMTAEKGEPLFWQIETETRPISITLVDQRVRVHGVDAWEMKELRGVDARNAVNRLLAGKTIKLTPRGKDKYGRLCAIVTLIDDKGKETILADWLIRNGHGVEYKK